MESEKRLMVNHCETEERGGSGFRGRSSLRQKAAWILFVVVIYCIAVTLVIAMERRILSDSVANLEELHKLAERQVALNITVSRAIFAINENYFSPDIDKSAKILVLELEPVLAGLTHLQSLYPAVKADVAVLQESSHQLSLAPSRSVIADLRTNFHRLTPNLDTITRDIGSQKQRVLADYRESFSRLTYEWIGFGILGIALLGGLMASFFRRLEEDIHRVRQRAVEIVGGYRGAPLPVTRNDELGSLIEAVNEMQRDLREHESQLEFGRQQQFHKEKMAAVGSLAAVVAHEINNPMSAIIGVAEAIEEESRTHKCQLNEAPCQPGLILDQARRVMAITRQIGAFSVPQSAYPELLDLNGLLRSTCNFVAYDRRFRLLQMDIELDNDVPAVFGVADHLTQIAMNLLINAGDALQGRHDPAPGIRVASFVKDDRVVFEVSDNGVGIEPAILDQIFTDYFTTKAPGSGTGLGLALCRRLIEDAGGDIVITSKLGVGTTASVSLPIPQPDKTLNLEKAVVHEIHEQIQRTTGCEPKPDG